MMASQFVVNVTEITFENEVVLFSKNKPVLVDFWAEWCRPCKSLGPILERIVNEAGGSLRLAKINIDQNPNLATQYNVRSIPTVKVFIDGHIANEFVGALPESRIREFVKSLTPPSPIDLDLSKGKNLLLSHEWKDAELIFRKVLEDRTDSPAALLGLAKSLLAQDKPLEALKILENIPAARESNQADLLKPYAKILADFHNNSLPDETDLDAIFYNSIRLSSQGKFSIALDGLIDILRQDKKYRNKTAQKVILGILEIIGKEDPNTRAYRAELASVLF
ncbi:MAG: thioredoxin, partial [Anaerolineaceae bacterium]|nr:thioredoxin [Anaerolineaceae bacterium]